MKEGFPDVLGAGISSNELIEATKSQSIYMEKLRASSRETSARLHLDSLGVAVFEVFRDVLSTQ
jgi:hypothetical protein